jgi:hypothetical protein
VLVSLTPTAENYDKTPGFNVDFRIVEGPTANPGAGVNRTLGRYYAMSAKENSQFGIAKVMGAAGQGAIQKALFERYKDQDLPYAVFSQMGKFMESKAKGALVVLTVYDRQSDRGNTFSDILEVQAGDDDTWGALKGTPLVGAPASNGAAAAPASNMSMQEAVSGMFENANP